MSEYTAPLMLESEYFVFPRKSYAEREERFEAKMRPLRELGDLLLTARNSVRRARGALTRRLYVRCAALPESKQVLLLLFYPATLGRGGTFEAVERLLAALEELLSEALESVRTSYRLCEKREGFLSWMWPFSWLTLSSRSFAWWRKDELLITEKLTLGGPAGQGDGSDTVRRLLTRVTEALAAAEQTLQSPDIKALTSEDSRRILKEALQLASAGHGCASTLYGASLELGLLCEADRNRWTTLAEYVRIATSVLRSSAAAGYPDDDLSVLRSYRINVEGAAADVGQGEAAQAAERLSRELEALLIAMKSALRTWGGAVQRLLYHHGKTPSFNPVSVGQGGGTASQGDGSVALQRLARDFLQLWTEGQTVLRRYITTIGQGGDAAGQGDNTVGQGGEPVGQGRDAAGPGGDAVGHGDTSQASPPLMIQCCKLIVCSMLGIQHAERMRRAKGSVLTFCKLSVDQKPLPEAARRLLKALEELLTVTESLVTSYRVPKRRGDKPVTGQLPLLEGPGGEKQKNPEPTPCCDHGWTGFLKSVWKGQTKFRLLAAVVSVLVIAGLVACIVVLRSNQHIEQQIQIKGVQSSAAERGKGVEVLPPCGHGWIWYRNKCYSFSEAEGTWAEAKDSCAALDSALAMIDTQKELNFMLRYKGDHNHWIGLRRDDKSQLWRWVNDTKFNNWFTVSDTSECAYLSYGQVKSLECDITNKWICTKVTINSI